MIKSTFGITKEPFNRSEPELLSQQKEILKLIKIHSQHGGFSVIIGNAGVGKSVLREHIEMLDKERDTVVGDHFHFKSSDLNFNGYSVHAE